MPPPWIPIIQSIINGEPVDAQVPNRPLGQLSQRTEYLRAIVNAIGAGKGSFDFEAALSLDVFEGAAVYWDTVKKEYALGLAAFDFSDANNFQSIAQSAFVVGVCIDKTTSTRGTVALWGRVDEVDFSISTEGSFVPGPYYLSAVDPGHLVTMRPPVGVLVMMGLDSISGTSSSAIVMPSPREMLQDHIHYKLSLTVDLAATTGDPGWFDSSDGVFGGLAPVGAIYGYLIDNDPKVKDLFPFMPPENTYLEVDGSGETGKFLVDLNGIWWVDDGNDPDAFTLMTVYFTKMVSRTDNATVTSLRPGEGSPIVYKDCDGNPATAGDLQSFLDVLFTEGGEEAEGFLVFKNIQEGNKLERGPIVESIATSTLQISFREIEGDPQGFTWPGDKGVSGELIIDFVPDDNPGREGEATVVALHNAREEAFESGGEEIPYLALPPTEFSKITYRFDIPSEGLGLGTYKFEFWAWILATIGSLPTGVDLPPVEVLYRVVPKVTVDPGSIENLTAGSFSSVVPLAINESTGRIAFDYVRGALGNINVNPGDQVILILQRQDSDAYNGDVGILRHGFTLTSI